VLLIEKYSGKYSQSNPDLSLKLEELKTTYASRASYAEAKRQTLQRALDTLKVESDNGVGSITKKITTFLKSTGLHLLVALLVFCLIFFGANFVFKKMMDFSRKNTPKETRFNYEYLAKIDGTVFLGALTLGTLLIPVVFLIFGNWLLISIFALLSLVIFWMVKDKIPDIIEEVRLILNIGAVREQERIIYNGIPWKVDEIKFYSQIINPNLEGGRLRIPLPELVGMHSRACKNLLIKGTGF